MNVSKGIFKFLTLSAAAYGVKQLFTNYRIVRRDNTRYVFVSIKDPIANVRADPPKEDSFDDVMGYMGESPCKETPVKYQECEIEFDDIPESETKSLRTTETTLSDKSDDPGKSTGPCAEEKAPAEKPRAAVYVDFENWYYSMRNIHGQRPNIREFYEEISSKYDIKRLFFFAQFDEAGLSFHEDIIRLYHGEIINTSSTARTHKNTTDSTILDKIYRDSVEYDDVDTYVLFTGDEDFAPAVTYLQEEKGKRVVIYAVTKAISCELKKVADETILIPFDPNSLSECCKAILDQLDYYDSRKKIVYATRPKLYSYFQKRFDKDTINKAIEAMIMYGVVSESKLREGLGNEWKNVIKANWQQAEKLKLWNPENAREMEK